MDVVGRATQSIFVIPSEMRNLFFLVFGFAFDRRDASFLLVQKRSVQEKKAPPMPWPAATRNVRCGLRAAQIRFPAQLS